MNRTQLKYKLGTQKIFFQNTSLKKQISQLQVLNKSDVNLNINLKDFTLKI